MKKTRIMSTIAMVCFIIALVWQVVNETIYYSNAFRYDFEAKLILRMLFFEAIPTIAGIILLIIAAKKARTGITPPQYKIGFFFLAGALLLNLIISAIMAQGDMSGSIAYIVRVVILIGAYFLVVFDSILLKPNKAMGIIGAAIIIAVSFIYSFMYTLELTRNMPRSYYGSYDALDFIMNLMTILSYYTSLQCIGIGALLYAIGRQPKDAQNTPAPPSYPNGGNGGQFNNQYNYQPPQTPDQNNYQLPPTPDRNNYQPPYNGQ